MHDVEFETHWWRIIDFPDIVAESRHALQSGKLQFSEPVVDFARFRLTLDSVEPLSKYLDEIRYVLARNIR